MPVQRVSNINVLREIPEWMPNLGNVRAPIIVVSDTPTLALWRQGVPIGGPALDTFAEYAQRYGFSREDFAFVSPCGPMPDEAKGSDKREKLFVDQYRECLKKTISVYTDARLYIYAGKIAGYALTGKPCAIMKQRGIARQVPDIGPALPMLSPNHVLQRPEVKELFDADFNMLRALRDSEWRIGAVSVEMQNAVYEWREDISDLLLNPPRGMSIDTETAPRAGLDYFVKATRWYRPEIVPLTVQMSWEPGHAIVLPVDRDYYPEISRRQCARLIEQIKQICENPEVKKFGHNPKFDMHVLRKSLGIDVEGMAGDTQLLAFFVDENMFEKSQDECVRRWVPEMAGYADQFNATYPKDNMRAVPRDALRQYAGGDTDANLRLAKRLLDLVRRDRKQWNCCQRIQWPATKAFAKVVEPQGMHIDVDALRNFHTELGQSSAQLYRDLIRLVPAAVKRRNLERGLEFTRDDFIRDILFTKDGFNLKSVVWTDGTKTLPSDQRVPSVSTKNHLPFFDDNEFVVKLIEYKKITKLQNTYVGVENGKHGPTGFWQYLYEGLIHPSYMLHRTVTGRCLPLSAEVITNHGPMTMGEISDYMDHRNNPLFVLTHNNRFRRITEFVSNGHREVFRVHAGSKVLEATANHPLWTPRGWTELASANVGSSTYTFDFEKDLSIEEWRSVVGTPSYSVSSHGRVRYEGDYYHNPRYVQPYNKGQWGHSKIKLGRDGREMAVHVLVCEAFHGPCPPGLEVLHLNGIPSYNHACNLRWGTSQENKQIMVVQGRSRRGERSSQVKLTDAQLAQARLLRDRDGLFYAQIAERFGVSETLIRFALQGRRRQPYIPAFVESTIDLVERVGVMPTYDLSVEEDHSFIANGFVVHNTASSDPNGQNIPKHGPLAKAYRRIFVPTPGYTFIECLPAGTWVTSGRGLVPIEKIVPGDTVLGHDRKLHTVKNAKKTGNARDVYRIHTSVSSTVEPTENHVVRVVRNGLFAWSRVDDLTPLDYLVTDDTPHEEGSKTVWNDKAYWVGYFMGDGSYTRQSPGCIGGYHRINFALGTDEAELYPKLKAYFGDLHIQRKGRGDVCLSNKGIWTSWQQDFPKAGSHSVRVPEKIMSGTGSIRRAFLAGAFDSDGSVHSRRLSIVSVSERYIDDLWVLAKSLGIHGKVHQTTNEYGPVYWFTVFEKESLNSFPRGKLQRKADALGVLADKQYTQCSSAEVPLSLVEARMRPGWQKYPSGNRLFRNGRRKGYVTRDAIRLAVQDNPDMIELLDLLKYRYARVKSVEFSRKADVYDLEVEGCASFVANGYMVHNCDLSQAELRLVAWMANEPTMLSIYRAGGDIHSMTAAMIMGLTLERFMLLPGDIRKKKRQEAKAVNFGLIYGMGWKKLIVYAKITYNVVFSEKEAQRIRDLYFKTYRRLMPWHAGMREFVRQHEYVRASHGAVRHLPNIRSNDEMIRSESERQAINSPIQRFGSDIGICAMQRLCRDAPTELVRPVAFIHDALICEVRNDYLVEGMQAVKFYMQSFPYEPWFNIRPPLPITADVSCGLNLASMEERTDIEAVAPSWYRIEEDGFESLDQAYSYALVQ